MATGREGPGEARTDGGREEPRSEEPQRGCTEDVARRVKPAPIQPAHVFKLWEDRASGHALQGGQRSAKKERWGGQWLGQNRVPEQTRGHLAGGRHLLQAVQTQYSCGHRPKEELRGTVRRQGPTGEPRPRLPSPALGVHGVQASLRCPVRSEGLATPCRVGAWTQAGPGQGPGPLSRKPERSQARTYPLSVLPSEGTEWREGRPTGCHPPLPPTCSPEGRR